MSAREFTYRTYFPDGSTVYISDESAGYERFIETYAYNGDLKVEVCRAQWGRSLDEAEVIRTTTLSELLNPYNLERIRKIKSLQKELTAIDKHILSKLGSDWTPPTTYEELENEKFKRTELKKAMAKLRRLNLVEYYRSRGNCLSRAGELIWDESLAKAQTAA